MPQPGDKVTALTHKQFFQLCEAIRTHREVVEKEGFTFPQLATFIQTKLDFKVTENNCQSATEAIEFTWERKRNVSIGKFSRGHVSVRLAELEKICKELTEQLETLLNAHLSLCQRLGERPTVGLPLTFRRTTSGHLINESREQ